MGNSLLPRNGFFSRSLYHCIAVVPRIFQKLGFDKIYPDFTIYKNKNLRVVLREGEIKLTMILHYVGFESLYIELHLADKELLESINVCL